MPEPRHASIAGSLEWLAQATGAAAVAIVSRLDGNFLIEECIPPPNRSGLVLPRPAGLAEHAPALIHTAAIRLPLDWTLLCNRRPQYIASHPLAGDTRTLIVAGTGHPPAPALVAFAASQADAILATGQGTERDLGLARHIRDLVDHLPFPVLFIDSRSFDTLINDPARALLAIAPGAAASARVHVVLRDLMARSGVEPALAFSPDGAEQVFDLVHESQQFEVTIRTIERDRLAGRLWVFRNVTAEREAARFKDELIANVSHELRTPLTSIVGALSLLKGMLAASAGPDAARLLTIADANARRLGRLVDDLLDAGRLEAHQLGIAPREVDLDWLLADTIELNRPFADRCAVGFRYTRSRRRIMALIDPDRMAQVLGNVLTNAAKFSPRGSAVAITLEPVGAMARVRIADQGRGMTPEFQQRLFTRFVRERDDAGRAPGTGLGLTIAKGIVEAMAGTIAIDSAPGQGTTVTIDVPLPGQAGSEATGGSPQMTADG